MDAGFDLISWLLPAGLFVIILYLLYEQQSNIWEKKKVPCLKRKFLFGNIWPALTLKRALAQYFDDMYKEAGDVPYFGFYVMNKPGLLIKNPEIIKNVLVKDFNVFMHRNFDISHNLDPIARGNTFFNNTARWRGLRANLSPMFTSSRIKFMFSLMSEVADDLKKKISKECDKEGVTDVLELNAQYTTDIISSVVMGFKSNCLTDPNSVYRKVGKKALELTAPRAFQFVTMFLTPPIANLLRYRSMPPETANMMGETFETMVKHRKENNVQRNDLIEHLNQLREKKNDGDPAKTLEPFEILGTLTSFFVAGFETTASTMSYTLYELAFNQDYQDLLRSEIKHSLAENNGNITYELVQNVKYLEWAVNETLRKYPLLGFLDRKCMADYKVPGHDLIIPAGTKIYISLNGLQRDPKYFPDPEKYDPYRFSEDRKQSIVPFTYIPFGEGPRICIGMRFGLMSAKTGLLQILRNFRVEPSDETPRKIQYHEHSILTTPKGLLKLKFVPDA
uniref:Cytochrome P450 n=1 Tax=Liposcelis entomophila TaxID=550478 RepID=A0A0U4HU05_9NEOP|nr:cytochrome P450 [Liposcelis entomophila]